MNSKILVGATLAAVFTVSLMMTPAIAGTFLDFTSSVKSDDNELKAAINADVDIPKDGTGNAFGYGIITIVEENPDIANILVTTTHAGVQDSIEQDGADDAEWHNHYVALTDANPLCPGLAVQDITWDAPGDVRVSGDKAKFDGPKSFTSTHSLSGEPVSFSANDDIGVTVSFTIDPVDGDGETSLTDIKAVCINDVNFVAPSGTLGKGN